MIESDRRDAERDKRARGILPNFWLIKSHFSRLEQPVGP